MMEYKISHGLTQINSTYDFFPITPKILTFNHYIFNKVSHRKPISKYRYL